MSLRTCELWEIVNQVVDRSKISDYSWSEDCCEFQFTYRGHRFCIDLDLSVMEFVTGAWMNTELAAELEIRAWSIYRNQP